MKLTEDFKEMLTAITNQINTLKSSPTQKDSLKALDPPTMVPANRRATSLFGGKSKNIGSMWTLKMMSAHQNSMNSSSRHNSKETLLWTSITSITTSRYVSIQ